MRLATTIALFLSASLTFAAPTEVTNNAPKCSVGVTPARKAQIQKAFTSSGVVPTLIPSIDPKLEVKVVYGTKQVNLGNSFTTAETLNQPNLTFNAEYGYDPAKTNYTFFLVDPDVPSPSAPNGVRMTYLHWEVAHAQPDCITTQKRQTVATYQSLTPASTEQHRYTFLVYREPANYQPDLVTPQVRPGFDVNAYAAKGGLKLVGGNFLREAITNT